MPSHFHAWCDANVLNLVNSVLYKQVKCLDFDKLLANFENPNSAPISLTSATLVSRSYHVSVYRAVTFIFCSVFEKLKDAFVYFIYASKSQWSCQICLHQNFVRTLSLITYNNQFQIFKINPKYCLVLELLFSLLSRQ